MLPGGSMCSSTNFIETKDKWLSWTNDEIVIWTITQEASHMTNCSNMEVFLILLPLGILWKEIKPKIVIGRWPMNDLTWSSDAWMRLDSARASWMTKLLALVIFRDSRRLWFSKMLPSAVASSYKEHTRKWHSRLCSSIPSISLRAVWQCWPVAPSTDKNTRVFRQREWHVFQVAVIVMLCRRWKVVSTFEV